MVVVEEVAVVAVSMGMDMVMDRPEVLDKVPTDRVATTKAMVSVYYICICIVLPWAFATGYLNPLMPDDGF